MASLRWDFGDTVVLATHSVDPERAPHAAVEMRERRLVPPVRHVLLRARPEAALDAFSQPEILAIDGVQGELEVGGPVALGLLGGGGLGNVERQLDGAVVDRLSGEHAPELDMIALVDEDGVGEERVELDRVPEKVPGRLLRIAHGGE